VFHLVRKPIRGDTLALPNNNVNNGFDNGIRKAIKHIKRLINTKGIKIINNMD